MKLIFKNYLINIKTSFVDIYQLVEESFKYTNAIHTIPSLYHIQHIDFIKWYFD